MLRICADRFGLQALRETGEINARIETDVLRVLVAVRDVLKFLFEWRLRRADELARGAAADGDEMVVAVGENRIARRLQLFRIGERGDERDAHFLTWNEGIFREDTVSGLDHAVHIPFRRAGLGEDFGERVLRADLDDDDLATFEIVGGFVWRFGRLENIGRVQIVRRRRFRLPGGACALCRDGRT